MSLQTGKKAALKESRALNPRPDAVTDEDFALCPFLDPDDVVQVKYEMVRRVRVDKVPVARAAAAFGFSPAELLCDRGRAGRGRAYRAGAGQARPEGPRKLTEEVMEFVEQLRALRCVPAAGPAGGRGPEAVRDHRSPAVGGESPGQAARTAHCGGSPPLLTRQCPRRTGPRWPAGMRTCGPRSSAAPTEDRDMAGQCWPAPAWPPGSRQSPESPFRPRPFSTSRPSRSRWQRSWWTCWHSWHGRRPEAVAADNHNDVARRVR